MIMIDIVIKMFNFYHHILTPNFWNKNYEFSYMKSSLFHLSQQFLLAYI